MVTPVPNYRLRILSQIIRVCIIPPAVTSVLPLPYLPPSLWLLLCLLSIPVTLTIRNLWSTHTQESQARRLGARMITRVRGRYPANIDILLAIVKSFKEEYILEYQRTLFERYGEVTLNLRLLWEDQIITIDEGHVKFVLSTGFEKFGKGYWAQEKIETFLGNGIFNRDGEEWKAHRILTRPFFARERTSDFHTFDKFATETLAVLDHASAKPYSKSVPEYATSWEHTTTPVDIQDLCARFTLDSASEFLFGACTDTLKGPLPIAGKTTMGPKGSRTEDAFGSFAVAFEAIQTHIALRFRYGNIVWPLLEIFHDQTLESTRIIRAWLDPMVKRAVQEREERKARRRTRAGSESPGAGEEATTFLAHLAETTDDTDFIRNELLNILLAARDTTASLLTYVTYIFAMHPDVMARLRAEVLEHCGTTGTPSYEVVRGMKYMRAVLNETLRLFPPVPLNNRQSINNHGTVLPSSNPTTRPSSPSSSSSSGLYMPPNTGIMFPTLLIQRRTDLWGSDADTFDPDRWLDKRIQRYTDNPLIFAPFNAGPRICLGQNFAYNEASYFLIKLLQRYDAVALAPDAQPATSRPPASWRAPGRCGRQTIEQLWPASAMTLYVRGGLWVRLRKAECS